MSYIIVLTKILFFLQYTMEITNCPHFCIVIYVMQIGYGNMKGI